MRPHTINQDTRKLVKVLQESTNPSEENRFSTMSGDEDKRRLAPDALLFMSAEHGHPYLLKIKLKYCRGDHGD